MSIDIEEIRSIYKDKTFYFSEETCDLITQFYDLIARERIVIYQEKQFIIPRAEIICIKDEIINGFVQKCLDGYCILINTGVLLEHRYFLEQLNWDNTCSSIDVKEYIDKLIDYSFLYIAFHEYAHVLCGHVDNYTELKIEQLAREVEADEVAVDYLIKYVSCNTSINRIQSELVALYLAIYYVLEELREKEYREDYNGRKLINYYDSKYYNNRSHPLYEQRHIYISAMFNVILQNKVLPIREEAKKAIDLLSIDEDKKIITNPSDKIVIDESIKRLNKGLQELRRKIPRLS